MITNICIEGIDKTGKNIIAEYVKILSNHKYTVFNRGILSELTYSRMFNRNCQYDLIPYKNFVIVYLTVDKEDWKVRCKLTNEKLINFEENLNNFDITASQLEHDEFIIKRFNTSIETPYQIAKKIIEFMENLNLR